MDFSITDTPQQQQFRADVRSCLQTTVPAELIDRDDVFREPFDVYLLQRELGRKLGDKGWLYPSAPVEYGGGGLDLDQTRVLMEELGQMGIDLPPYYDSGGVLGSMAILVWGTPEQKAHFLPPIYRGQVRTWQLLSEPEAGSDVANVKTTAIRDGDSYLVTGQKMFVGSEHGADALWTLVCTDPAGMRHENLSWLMIDAQASGIDIQPIRVLGGHNKNMVFFDRVRVSAFNLIGGENQGWRVATTHLELEHGFRSDRVLVGLRTQRLMDRLVSYCRASERGGRRLIDDPQIRDLLAQIHIRKQVQRVLGERNFWLATSQQKLSYEGSQAYYLEKTSATWIAGLLADIVGPFGFTDDPEIGAAAGALATEQPHGILTHGGGTPDIQKLVMARRLGIGRQAVEQAGPLH